jgi:8-oxo-dGTP pyrophosphatase MutT (NUDIX family)
VTPARPAATLLLVRDAEAGLEVFMMRRHPDSDFAGGAYVFPGGGVDPGDHDPELGRRCASRTDRSASAALGLERGGLAYWVAAIRECFEESGVLFAYARSGELVDFGDPAVAERYRRLRRELARGAISMAALVGREGLGLATDRVHYWAHWVTPEDQPRRYDARFFLAVAPQGQIAAHDGTELTAAAWVTPAAALANAAREEWTVIRPTLHNLESLAAIPTAAAAERTARTRGVVPRIEPRTLREGGRLRFVLPGEPGYDRAPAEGVADPGDAAPPGSAGRARPEPAS